MYTKFLVPFDVSCDFLFFFFFLFTLAWISNTQSGTVGLLRSPGGLVEPEVFIVQIDGAVPQPVVVEEGGHVGPLLGVILAALLEEVLTGVGELP